MLRALLFDLDGTLIDSESNAIRVILAEFSDRGHPISYEKAHLVVGRRLDTALDLMLEGHPLRGEKKAISGGIHHGYRASMAAGPIVVPGAIEAVRALSATFPMAVVSGSLHEEIEWALGKMGILDCFQFLLGGDEYRESKPSPVGYQLALSRLGLTGREVLVFEDSVAGISSGRSAGAWVAAIEAANHFGHDQSAAHVRIPDFQAVNRSLIERWSVDWARR